MTFRRLHQHEDSPHHHPQNMSNSIRDHFVTAAIPQRNREAPVETPKFNPQFTAPDFAKEFTQGISKFS